MPLPRCVVLIEACEESGSVDLPAHLDALGERLGRARRSSCASMPSAATTIRCGARPRCAAISSARCACACSPRACTRAWRPASRRRPFASSSSCSRASRTRSPAMCCSMSCTSTLPADRRAQARAAAQVLGRRGGRQDPLGAGVQPLSNDPTELLINSTWRATLAVTGAEGLPPLRLGRQRAAAGARAQAVAAPAADLRCRARARRRCAQALERDPPYGAQVSFEVRSATGGWNAPGVRAVARAVDQPRLARGLRARGGAHRLRRHDSVHGHAGRAVSRARSSSSPACSVRTPTRTVRTSSCTSTTRRSSPRACRWCSRTTRARRA